MNINEELLDELMNTVTGGSPTDFAEALDKAMKVKCADGIDARRTELAGGIHESKDEDESYDDEEEEEELDEAADVDGKDNDDKEDDGDGLDDVGDEDSDVDNDGDSDSSDEYLTKRRKAIQKDVRSERREYYDDDGYPVRDTWDGEKPKPTPGRGRNYPRPKPKSGGSKKSDKKNEKTIAEARNFLGLDEAKAM